MNNSQFLSQALSKITGMDSKKVSIVSTSISKNQVIRAICEDPIIFGNEKHYRKKRTIKKKTYA